MSARTGLMNGLLVAVMLLGLAACGGEAESVTVVDAPEEVVELSPEELGELGVRLEAEPDRIEEILGEHGLTLETYEAAIRRVTENPGEARRYAEAYDNARG